MKNNEEGLVESLVPESQAAASQKHAEKALERKVQEQKQQDKLTKQTLKMEESIAANQINRNKRIKATSTVRLTESAMMITIAALLSMAKLIDMPYGGSVTMASMLPLVIIAYRHGTGWGILTGFAYGLVQFALGTKNLSYIPHTFASVATLIAADYLAAFAVLGFGGIFRRVTKRQTTAIALGSILVAVLRYLCHVISGVTVWADFSMSKAGLIYSLSYNATYMLPEMLILVVAGIFLSNALDFRGEGLRPMPKEEQTSPASGLLLAACALFAFAASFDVVNIFKELQDPDTGAFTKAGLSNVNWVLLILVTVICVGAAIALMVVRKNLKKDQAAEKAARK